MNITSCPKCGGSVRAETIGWFCNECRGFIDMHGRYYPYKNKSFLPPQTNADHIRSTTDEELAKWLCFRIECYGEEDPCPAHAFCKPGGQNGMLDWLQQPYKENEDEKAL